MFLGRLVPFNQQNCNCSEENKKKSLMQLVVTWMGTTHTEIDMKTYLKPLYPLLNDCKDDVTYTNEEGQTLLYLFVYNFVKERNNITTREMAKDSAFVRALCERGASIIVSDQNGNTPLEVVSKRKRLDLVDTMVKFSVADINARNSLGDTALHIALRNYIGINNISDSREYRRYLAIIAELINQGSNLNLLDKNNMSPVHLAAKSCHIRLLALFVRFQACLHCRTSNGDDLLILACKGVMDKQCDGLQALCVITWLLDNDFNVNCKNNAGFTPLHYASQCYNLAVTETLIKAGANVCAEASDDTTPLHSAIMSGSIEVMQYLIDRDVQSYQRDNVYGFSLMHMTAFSCEEEKFDWLLTNGFDPNDLTECDLTPLHLAAMVGNSKIVKKLIDSGVNINCREKSCAYTPLHLASMRGRFVTIQDINPAALDADESLVTACFNNLKFRTDSTTDYKSTIDCLLKAGAEVNAKDSFRRTPLHYVTRQSNNGLVEILLKADAIVDAGDKNNVIPLHNCILNFNEEALKYLLLYGADINDIDNSYYEVLKEANLSQRQILYDIMDYIIKLEAAGLPVHNVYREFIESEFLEDLYIESFMEVKKMKEKMMTANISLYNWLHMRPKRRFNFISYLPKNLKTEFPVYHDVIQSFKQEAIIRKSLHEPATLAYQFLTGYHWPELCTDHILSYLNNRSLRVMIESATGIKTEKSTKIEKFKSKCMQLVHKMKVQMQIS